MSEHARENAERLILLTEKLTEQIALDARAFEARRPHEAHERLEETGRLANLYRHECARVRQDPSLINGAPQPLRQRLRKATEAFEAVLARHGRALQAAKTVTEGVVRAIAEEVAAARTASAGYGPGARMAPVNTSAIALNRRA